MDEFELVIEEGTVATGPYQFERRLDITSIKFPKSIKRISMCAFRNCKNLKIVDLPEGITHIDNYAFYGTPAVIFVPESIEEIDKEAFGKNNIVFFECGEKDFKGHFSTDTIYDYPDSFYRGPSMGGTTIFYYYYEKGADLRFNCSHDDFLKYIEDNNS